MRPILAAAGLTAAIALAPAVSEAACPQRTTGTVVGALAGGLLGNAVAGHGAHTEGTLLGAAAGGLVGNQITKCRYSRRAYAPHRASSRKAARAPQARASARRCRFETRPFYDAAGRLVYSPTQVCR
jgi:uncharacterized protein YcfJ